MAINLARCQALCAAELNAVHGGTYSATPDDDFWQAQQITDAILEADKAIIATILDTPNSRHYFDYLSDITVTNGQIVLGRIGGVTIDGKAGKPVPADRLRLNNDTVITGLAALCTGQYCVESQKVFFIGTLCKVETSVYSDASTSTGSPNEYEMLATCGALAILFPRNGAYVAAAGHYAGLFQAGLAAIRQSAQLPTFISYRQQLGV